MDKFNSTAIAAAAVAMSFYTRIGDPHRFEQTSDVGPYLGLVPRTNQSGAVRLSGRITKMGNSMTPHAPGVGSEVDDPAAEQGLRASPLGGED